MPISANQTSGSCWSCLRGEVGSFSMSADYNYHECERIRLIKLSQDNSVLFFHLLRTLGVRADLAGLGVHLTVECQGGARPTDVEGALAAVQKMGGVIFAEEALARMGE
jgi:hypothetical protein